MLRDSGIIKEFETANTTTPQEPELESLVAPAVLTPAMKSTLDAAPPARMEINLENDFIDHESNILEDIATAHLASYEMDSLTGTQGSVKFLKDYEAQSTGELISPEIAEAQLGYKPDKPVTKGQIDLIKNHKQKIQELEMLKNSVKSSFVKNIFSFTGSISQGLNDPYELIPNIALSLGGGAVLRSLKMLPKSLTGKIGVEVAENLVGSSLSFLPTSKARALRGEQSDAAKEIAANTLIGSALGVGMISKGHMAAKTHRNMLDDIGTALAKKEERKMAEAVATETAQVAPAKVEDVNLPPEKPTVRDHIDPSSRYAIDKMQVDLIAQGVDPEGPMMHIEEHVQSKIEITPEVEDSLAKTFGEEKAAKILEDSDNVLEVRQKVAKEVESMPPEMQQEAIDGFFNSLKDGGYRNMDVMDSGKINLKDMPESVLNKVADDVNLQKAQDRMVTFDEDILTSSYESKLKNRSKEIDLEYETAKKNGMLLEEDEKFFKDLKQEEVDLEQELTHQKAYADCKLQGF